MDDSSVFSHEVSVLDLNQDIDDSHDVLTSSTSIDYGGRVNIHIRRRKRQGFSRLFQSQPKYTSLVDTTLEEQLLENEASSSLAFDYPPPPPLNIVIQIVGSRGDVQPFIALGLELKNKFNHRVRIATHAVFKTFVEENDLEFFNIGGNPEELMAFMVRNPGLLPSYEALRDGNVKQQRKNMYEILKGCWRSCIETGDGTNINLVSEGHTNESNGVRYRPRPFVADAIIANPPSFAHIHCAERLGIPLHLMFTRMPYSPTEAFPHPLANIRSSEMGNAITNRISYALIERLTWQGLGDLINKFRESKLGLKPLSLLWATGLVTKLKIPCTYCWSSLLLPKPRDWGSHISVSGYYLLPPNASFNPPKDLLDFLNVGEPPIYIGFGSIIVDNPDSMTAMIFEAVKLAGVRALVSQGWGGFGRSGLELPEHIFLLGNVPHTWLFDRVSAVIHHGGAGTTAAGLAAGKPTVVVPFFGDQPFWGSIVADAGLGPSPIVYSKLNAEKLAQQIRDALCLETRTKARQFGLRLQQERGCENGANSFHKALQKLQTRCSLSTERVAVWKVRDKNAHLSAFAAAVLFHRGLLDFKDISILRQHEYELEDRPTDPITGGAAAFLGSFGTIMYELYSVPKQIALIIQDEGSHSNSQLRKGKQIAADNAQPQSRNGHPAALESGSFAECSHGRKSGLLKLSTISLVTAKGIGRLTRATLTSPLHFSMGIARGFQNIPIIYRDTMVRRPGKVDGIVSGVEVGFKELGYGFYDGVVGIVQQPIQGAKESGASGLVIGIGKGLGGLILKPGAGLFGLPAYALQGISQQLHTMFLKDYDRHIELSRLWQGREEMGRSNAEEQDEVIAAWGRLTDA